MEGIVFPDAAVAATLVPKYVEARLHTDGGPRKDENRRLQEQMSGRAGNPVYVLYDPVAGRQLAEDGGYIFARDFVKFLESGLQLRP